MNESERIHKMVEAGTITGDEAERLLSVLREIDEAEGDLEASATAMEDEARRAASPASGDGVPPAPARSERATAQVAAATGPSAARADAPAPAEGASATPSAPEGTRWVRVSLLAGDLTLRADPDLYEVVVEDAPEGVQVERTDDGFAVRRPLPEREGSWIERFVTRLRADDLVVRIPADHGVDLDVTAGDVELVGVPYLRGHLTSGDLDARGLRGIDFRTAAGDLDLELTLTEGHHRLRATAGDVNVRLTGGSDVTLRGSVAIGEASVRGAGLEIERRGLGQRFTGKAGSGTAELELHVTTGDLDVKVDDER